MNICLIWANQNNLFESTSDQLIGETTKVAAQSDGVTTPLAVPLFGVLIDSFNPLVAGLLMVASSIFVGWRVTACVFPGLAVILAGKHLGLPELISLPYFDSTSIVVCGGLFGGGIVLSRYVK